MRNRNNNIQRNREEQLQLHGILTIVYDVIRDLGLHYELIEISGCSNITIGRSHHQFSHLDKDLACTAQAERMGSLHYDNHNNANNRGLENVRAKLTRAQDDLEDKNDKLIVVTSQKIGIEKKLNKLLKEMDQLKEDHELELTSLLNQLYLEKSIINLEKKEETEYVP